MGADGEGSKQVRLVSSSVWTDHWCGAWVHEEGQWRMEADDVNSHQHASQKLEQKYES